MPAAHNPVVEPRFHRSFAAGQDARVFCSVYRSFLSLNVMQGSTPTTTINALVPADIRGGMKSQGWPGLAMFGVNHSHLYLPERTCAELMGWLRECGIEVREDAR